MSELNDQEDLRYMAQFTELDVRNADFKDLAKRIRALAEEVSVNCRAASAEQQQQEPASKIAELLWSLFEFGKHHYRGAAKEAIEELLKLYTHQQPQGDTVPMPQNADQAQMMANLGISWLEANAPERLKQPQVQGELVADLRVPTHDEYHQLAFDISTPDDDGEWYRFTPFELDEFVRKLFCYAGSDKISDILFRLRDEQRRVPDGDGTNDSK